MSPKGAFSAAVEEWASYFAYTGGAAAALLGLLFVAVSLRLDLFRRPEVADIRDDATATFGALLAAMAISGAALAPNAQHGVVAGVAVAVGAVGMGASGWLVRQWWWVSAAARAEGSTLNPRDAAFLAILGLPFVGLLAAGIALRGGDAGPLALLAASQGLLLGTGSLAAWLMLAHARPGDG